MSRPGLDAWQVCLVVTALVVIAETGVNALLKRDINIILHKRVRTGALGALLLLTAISFVVALGPSLADELSSVAAAVAAVVALWLTSRSLHSSRDADLSGTGSPPDEPPGSPGGEGSEGGAGSR
jgi:uncharacterized membrane protein YgcG